MLDPLNNLSKLCLLGVFPIGLGFLDLNLTASNALVRNWPILPTARKILSQEAHSINKMTVIGSVAARNNHQSPVTVSTPPWPLKNAMPKKLETAVAGRKIIVKAAIVFIAALSFLVSRAIAMLVSLSCWVTKLKTYFPGTVSQT